MKKGLLWLLVVVLIVVVVAVIFVRQKPKETKIGMVISTLNNPFFVTLKEGAEAAAKELGYELIILDSQNDSAKERANVDDLVQKGVSVLLINPVDSDAAAVSVNAAIAKKIKVISVDRGVNGADVDSHIASDNVAGGKMAAEFILEALADKDVIKVVELQGIPGTSAARDRGEGFNSVMKNEPKVQIVASQAGDFDRQKGLDVMSNIIQANPDFDAVFAHNDEMALGAIAALKSAGKTNVLVVGFDAIDDAVKSVESGEMATTVAQQPDLMGKLAVENAVKLIKGESVEKFVPVELKLVVK